ncbi:MAG: hypothetical protein GY729_12520 [Desulfobacteraceae bacterium]|nr:hypothetical protein [Desulfobacteraceae bacterium]
MKDKYKIVVGLAVIILCVVTINSTKQALRLSKKKIKAQHENNVALDRFKSIYDGLKPVKDNWNTTYQDSAKFKDHLRLYEMLGIERYGLKSDAEKLNPKEIERVYYQGTNIGLDRICLKSKNASGFLITANSFSDMMKGLDNLTKRKDIRMDNIKLVLQKQQPSAVIENFCVLFRSKIKEGAL